VSRYPLAEPKWALPSISALSGSMQQRIQERIQENYQKLGDEVSFGEAASARTMELLSKDEVDQISGAVVTAFMEAEGRKLLSGSEIAVDENPELYILRSEWAAAQEGRDDLSDLPEGAIGRGDNVFRFHDVEGEVLVLREVAEITRLIEEGVPEGVIAVIDDSGGTMTAPILPEFEAVLCRAGTVRSHLAIIAREFEVPVLMGCVFKREPVTGERLRVRYSSDAQNADAYHGGEIKPQALIEEVQA
jgi:phosphohistidine swiveling domain-containing protein